MVKKDQIENIGYPKQDLYRQIVAAKLFMDDNFSEDIDIEAISERAHCSKFHFIRLFKSIYKITPHRYLVSVRLNRAKLLIRSGMTTSQACAEVGFESPSTFKALFKSKMDCTISDDRKFYLRSLRQLELRPSASVPSCLQRQELKNSNFQDPLGS